jgi:hypothetical protein
MSKKKLPPKIKLTIIAILWFLIILVWMFAVQGCATNNVQPEFQDLLFEEDSRDLARKSVTAEDYIIKEEC